MRKLTAALACRAEGSRLYGKPLQNLDVPQQVTILDHIVSVLQRIPCIGDIVLGVSIGNANLAFYDLASRRGLQAISGDPRDVLQRLVQCAEQVGGTDIFRVTTECPFFHYEMIQEAWETHLRDQNDVTVIEGVPEGGHFEIYRYEALEKSHRLGDERHRSEFCSLYIRENTRDFKIGVLEVPAELQDSQDIRLTVDYPEDLQLCRALYGEFAAKAPLISLRDLIPFLHANPQLKSMVAQHVTCARVWAPSPGPIQATETLA